MSAGSNGYKRVRFGMVINVDKCTGCGACMVACASENNVNVRPDESDKVRSITWMRVYRIDNGKKFPKHEVAYLPRPCMQCEGARHHHFFGQPAGQRGADPHHDKHGSPDTPCVSVCPPTATDYDPEGGFVSQIYTRCIGCRYCVAACPYHARYFNWWDCDWPAGMERFLSPDVSPRMRGVVEKCTFCHHRYMLARQKMIQDGRKELKEGEYVTACAQACPAGAITFGQLTNPDHEVTKLAKLTKSGKSFRLLERLRTNPKVYYYSEREWVRLMADNSVQRPFRARIWR